MAIDNQSRATVLATIPGSSLTGGASVDLSTYGILLADGDYADITTNQEEITVVRKFDDSSLLQGVLTSDEAWDAWTLTNTDASGSSMYTLTGSNIVFSETGTDYVFTRAGGDENLPVISSGDTVYIVRSTLRKSAMVTFQPASRITAANLNTATQQLLFLLQEIEDKFHNFDKLSPFYGTPGGFATLGADGTLENTQLVGNIINFSSTLDKWDAESQKIGNMLDPVDETDAATKDYVDNAMNYTTPSGTPQTGSITVTAGTAGTGQDYTLPFTALSTNVSTWIVHHNTTFLKPTTDFTIHATNNTINIVGTTVDTDVISVQNIGAEVYPAPPSSPQSGTVTVTSGTAGTDQTYTLPFTPSSTTTTSYIVMIDGVSQIPFTDFTVDSNGITILGTTVDGDVISVQNIGISKSTLTEDPSIIGDLSVAGDLTVTGAVSGNVTSSSSTTARSLADRFADVINVKDYGAAGDGTTNDRTAIVAALAVANTKWNANKSAVLYFPPGDYLYTPTVASDVYLELDADQTNTNWEARPSVIGCGKGSRLIGVGIKTDNSYTHISDLKLSGNSDVSNPGEHAIKIVEEDPDAIGPAYVEISNCTIEDYNTGIYWDEATGHGSARCRVSNVLVRDCTTGMYSKDTRGIDVIDSIFANNTEYGVKVEGAGSLKMSHCSVIDNGRYGLYLVNPTDSDTIFESYFVNCTLTGNGSSSTPISITGITDHGGSHAGKAKITLDSNHEVPLNGYISTESLRIGGSTESGPVNIKVLDITSSTVLTLDRAAATFQSGDLWQKINWDLYIDGSNGYSSENSPDGRVYNLFFTNCNINTSRLNNCRNIRFTNCKLIQNIQMTATCEGVSFIGAWTTDGSKDNTPMLPSGSSADTGWSEISAGFYGTDLGRNDVRLRVPAAAPVTDAGGTPTRFAGPLISKYGELPEVLGDSVSFADIPANKTVWITSSHTQAPTAVGGENWWVCQIIGNQETAPENRYIIAYGYDTDSNPDIFSGTVVLGSFLTTDSSPQWTYLGSEVNNIATEYTVASGIITLNGQPSIITVDTENDDGTDNLENISGGTAGQRILVKAVDASRVVTLKTTGNLNLTADFALDSADHFIELIYMTISGHSVSVDGWYEVSRNDI